MGYSRTLPPQKLESRPGDKIVRVDDIENPNWEQMDFKEALSPESAFEIRYRAQRPVISEQITSSRSRLGSQSIREIWAGAQGDQPLSLTSIEPGMPAEKAGMKVGDEILTANGQPIPAIEALVDILAHTKDQPLEIVALRNGQKLTFNVQPVLAPSRSSRGAALSDRAWPEPPTKVVEAHSLGRPSTAPLATTRKVPS